MYLIEEGDIDRLLKGEIRKEDLLIAEPIEVLDLDNCEEIQVSHIIKYKEQYDNGKDYFTLIKSREKSEDDVELCENCRDKTIKEAWVLKYDNCGIGYCKKCLKEIYANSLVKVIRVKQEKLE